MSSTDPSPFFGTPADRREALVVLLGATALSVLYSIVAGRVDALPGRLEFLGTATGLANVWLVRKQNVLSWPIGVVMVSAIGTVFYSMGLVGQASLHLLYFFPLQFWGWWLWVRGGEDRSTLHVSWTPRVEWIVYLPLYLLGTVAMGRLFAQLYDLAAFVYWDASIVAASVIALFLQSRKKVESWFLWIGPVNVAAIGLYLITGATMFAALYVVFLLNAVMGVRDWIVDAREHRDTSNAGA
jgi:nicotinamide mononucleotide transporter